jgi:prefoldin subunit 5
MKNSISKLDFYNDYISYIDGLIEEYKTQLLTINTQIGNLESEIDNIISRLKIDNTSIFTIGNKINAILRLSKDNITISRFPVASDDATKPVLVKDVIGIKHTYRELTNAIPKLNNKIKSLNTNKIDYNTYSNLADVYNKESVKMLANGAMVSLGNGCGNLRVIRVKRTAETCRKLNHKASKKYKAYLISKGIELYDKDKAEECAKNNIPYNGADWRIYYDDDYYLYVEWSFYVNDIGEYYSFVPNRTCNIDRKEVETSIKTIEDIFEYPMGIVKYLSILDNKFPTYHTIFDSLSN